MIFKKIDEHKNNSEILSTTKIGEHIPCEYSMYTIWTFDCIENKHDVYRRENAIKISCESIREYIMYIINFEKNEMILLTNEE